MSTMIDISVDMQHALKKKPQLGNRR